MIERRTDLIFTRSNDLSGRGRRRGAMIGSEIGDREIGFVAHCGDYRNRRLANRTRDLFLVESPEISRRATATAHDQHIDEIRRATFAERTFVVEVDKTNRAR